MGVTNARESFRPIHIRTIVFLNPLATSFPTSQQLPLNPTLHIRRQCGSDPNDQGRSPNLRHGTRTYRVALDWLFERVNLDHTLLMRYVRTHDKLVDILTLGTSPGSNGNHCSVYGKSDDPMDQVMPATFLANLSLAQLEQSPKQSLR